MKYIRNLALRLAAALAIALSFNLFYIVLNPLTLFLSYHVLKIFYSPVLGINTITIGSHVLRFIPACAAASAYLLLALLILLTKGIPFRLGMKMFLIGSLLILAANLLRITILIIVLLELGKDYFVTLHLFFWKVVSSIFVAFVWILLTHKFKIKAMPIYSDIKEIISRLA